MKVFLHPAAESDVEETAEFYERTGSPALAAKFVAEFKRVSLLLLAFPGIGSPRSRGRQGFSMKHISLHRDLSLQRRGNHGLGCEA
jgi:toxin ParE1/3/4